MDIKKIKQSIGEQYAYVLRSDIYTDEVRKQIIAAMDDMVELTSKITGYTVTELKELVPDGRPVPEPA
jgi:hypothetical protein